MLVMPRIHRRPIERLKSNRTLNVHKTQKSRPVSRDDQPARKERRATRDRRRNPLPVGEDKRGQDRRLARKRLPPGIKRMLENAGGDAGPASQREGVYIDETV